MKCLFALFLIAGFCSAPIVFGADWSPWDQEQHSSTCTGTQKTVGYLAKASTAAIRLYQEFVSEVIGARCTMWPSCSQYGLQAIEKHGFTLGVAMIADRLIHEIEEQQSAPLIKTPQGFRYQDPLVANDFWLKGGKK